MNSEVGTSLSLAQPEGRFGAGGNAPLSRRSERRWEREELTTIVAPLTTSRGDHLYPFGVLVSADECALREDSVLLCNQTRTVSIEDHITDNIGWVYWNSQNQTYLPRESLSAEHTSNSCTLPLEQITRRFGPSRRPAL